MRLLERTDDGRFTLTKDLRPADIPRYAILSHTWGPDIEEVTYKDLVDGIGDDKPGFEKIKFCAEQAARDGLRAINSMFNWYKNSARCFVYLSDVSNIAAQSTSQQTELALELALQGSRWFTRGWTLQELVAPTSVEFFTKQGQRLGDKRSLERYIHNITGIPVSVLRGRSLSEYGVDERFKWAEQRQTTHDEDLVYCLLGIFGVFMPLIYGEGKASASRRLRNEIADLTSQEAVSRSRKYKRRTWMVPFERNLSFVGRAAESERLRQALFQVRQTSKVAITGLGGCGKTQVVLELIYQLIAPNKECSVIWIPSMNRDRFEKAYLDAARQLGVPGYEEDEADVKRMVQTYLSSEEAGQWLLVFDDADDISMWTERSGPTGNCLIDYLPRSNRGSIIFTTRDKQAAVTLAGRETIVISQMTPADGQQLLRGYLIHRGMDPQDDGEMTDLLGRLSHLPLAISQALRYITRNGISLRDYISLLDEEEEDVIDLLSEDFHFESRHHDIKGPVATTWLISFEQIRQRNRLAADYLSFMACLGTEDIPRSLLPPGRSRKQEIDAIGALHGFSFIIENHKNSTFAVHRLVHLAARNWLRKEGTLASWTRRVSIRLSEVLRDLPYDDREAWAPYGPHVDYVLNSSVAPNNDYSWLSLLSKYGICLYFVRRYKQAEDVLQQVINSGMGSTREELETISEAMFFLSLTYKGSEQYAKAEMWSSSVMLIWQKDLGYNILKP